jgi:hypothetical protein
VIINLMMKKRAVSIFNEEEENLILKHKSFPSLMENILSHEDMEDL